MNKLSKIKLKNCKNCGEEFEAYPTQRKYCSEECKSISFKKIKQKYIRNIHENYNGKEGIDYIYCQLCGLKVKRIYGKHLKIYHNGLTSNDYKKMFPNTPLSTIKDRNNISINSGKHMKKEKYKKMFSDKFKGNKNPNHKSNTTEQHRKELSPFSKEFYKKRGLSEKERIKFINNALKNREFETRIDYWIKRGFSKDEANEKIKERQRTFTLEKCIEKYGNEKGLERWKERQEKWKRKVFNKEQYIGRGESKLSNKIIKDITKNGKDNLLYGENEKFIYDKKLKRAYKYDLVNISNKRIIEINGTFWHCKPTLYESEYLHKVKKMYAKEIWAYDRRKIEIAEEKGYKVLVIWEDDYYNNPTTIINKCIEFIYEKDTKENSIMVNSNN